MDENWGNILPFILMALFAIYSAINKKKKAANSLISDEKEEDERPSDLENIFGSLLGANTFEPQQEHPYQVMQDEFIEDEIEDLPREEVKIESVKYNSPLKVEVEDVVEEMDEDVIEFDWKQAIISKEILDRKYI